MILGLLSGLVMGPRIAPVGEIGRLVIQVIKAVATPLLFLTIVNSVIQVEIRLKDLARMLVIVVVNALIALSIVFLFL